jgi:hypothetical protein
VALLPKKQKGMETDMSHGPLVGDAPMFAQVEDVT